MTTLIATCVVFGDFFGQSTVNYATVHNQANANSVDADLFHGQTTYAVGGTTYWEIYRNGLTFDTSSLTASATISAATLSLYVGATGDGSATDFEITVVSGADLTDTFVVGDYGEILARTTSFGSLDTSLIATGAWNVITLNATGIAAISKTGTTRFALRSSRDISTTTPTGLEFVEFNSTTNLPKLTITYTTGLTPTATGCLWVEGDDLHYTDSTAAEKVLTGTAGSTVGTAGDLWVETTGLHYIDSSGVERTLTGTLDGAGTTDGCLWVEGANLRYIDDSSQERYLAGA